MSVCFLGGSSRGRTPWRGGTDTYKERGHPDDEWQTARGSRRSYHDNEDVRWGSSSERLPEWSNDDNDDFKTPGTFDSSGAFVLKVTLFLIQINIGILVTCTSSCIFGSATLVIHKQKSSPKDGYSYVLKVLGFFFSKRKKKIEVKLRQKVKKKVKILRKVEKLRCVDLN